MREALPGIEALRPADGPLLVAVGSSTGSTAATSTSCESCAGPPAGSTRGPPS